MQCPSCRSEISENQFYCPVCRASVYSYTPENSRSAGSGGQVGRAGKRLLDVLLLLILIGAGIVIGRAIKWNELLSNFLPGFQAQPATKPERQPTSSPNSSSSNSSGKQRASEPSKDSSKTSGEKPADSAKPASAESVRDLKQKIEELPESGLSGETKPTPKPTTQPTPKPPSSNNDRQ